MEVPTHVTGALAFECGALVTLLVGAFALAAAGCGGEDGGSAGEGTGTSEADGVSALPEPTSLPSAQSCCCSSAGAQWTWNWMPRPGMPVPGKRFSIPRNRSAIIKCQSAGMVSFL